MHLQGAAGVLDFSGSRGITDLASFIKRYEDSKSLIVVDQNLLKDLFMPTKESDRKTEEMIEALNKLIDITDDERGIVLSFQENILFDPGKAIIKNEVIFNILKKVKSS